MVQFFSGVKLWLFPSVHVPEEEDRHKLANEERTRSVEELRQFLEQDRECELDRKIASISALLTEEAKP